MCGNELIKPFYPLRWCCEERAGLFKCQERSKSSFHHCGNPVRLVPACLNAGKMCEPAVLTTVEEL